MALIRDSKSQVMSVFKFQPLGIKDLNQLYQWFQEPIINHWYARDKSWSLDEITEKYEPRIAGMEHVPSFIVYKYDLPFGFVQFYLLTDSLPDGIDGYESLLFEKYNPRDLAGIDLFIAESQGRGKGLGVELINCFINKFLTRFKSIVIDPDVNNQQAIRCYEKAGFQRTDFSQDPNHLIMIKPLSLTTGN
ncbi:TPA: GNAT family N-acetyltransferase [Legionella pneumophila]|nr:GNAT family N-acetyltransferase [Legionella pneumophila]